jgi:hypothetical protein
VFSRIASQQNIPTLAFDIDPLAVEKNYLDCAAHQEAQLLPLVLDLTNPSPSLGWNNAERMSLLQRAPADAALALALIHHLAIANNVPLEALEEFFRGICRWLVIEFVPKEDPRRKTAGIPPDIRRNIPRRISKPLSAQLSHPCQGGAAGLAAHAVPDGAQ